MTKLPLAVSPSRLARMTMRTVLWPRLCAAGLALALPTMPAMAGREAPAAVQTGDLAAALKSIVSQRLIPALDGGDGRLYSIPGRIPDPDEPIAGCRFGPRCAHVQPICRAALPDLAAIGPDHRVRCTPRTSGRSAA